MATDPDASNNGNGDGTGKSKWEEAGFETEAAMIEAAKAVTDLRSKIEKAEADLTKERAAKSKTDSEFMRQAQEIGDLRKKLKELEKTPDAKLNADAATRTDPTDDDVLDTVSVEEGAKLDGVLNDPKNAKLKEQVALGGTKAMAEFVKAYHKNAPVDLSVPLFGSRKAKKSGTADPSSIEKQVKDLFKQHNQEETNNLAATGAVGASPQKRSETKGERKIYGGVDASFYRADA